MLSYSWFLTCDQRTGPVVCAVVYGGFQHPRAGAIPTARAGLSTVLYTSIILSDTEDGYGR